MSKTINEERLRWVRPIAAKEITLVDAARVCPYSTRSLECRVAAYKRHGEDGLAPKSTARKTQERETPIRIKEHVIELRNQTKKCALKLHWQMKKEGLLQTQRSLGEVAVRVGYGVSGAWHCALFNRSGQTCAERYGREKPSRRPGEVL